MPIREAQKAESEREENRKSLKKECSTVSNVAKKKDKGEMFIDIAKRELLVTLFQRCGGAETRMQWVEE